MILNSSCFILCLGCTVKSAARFTTLPQISLALFFLIGPYAIPLAFLKWKAEQQMSTQAVQDTCVVKRIQVSYLTPPLGIYWRMRCDVCIWFFRPEEPGCLCLWMVKMHIGEPGKMPLKEQWRFWSITKDAAFVQGGFRYMCWAGTTLLLTGMTYEVVWERYSLCLYFISLFISRITEWFMWEGTSGSLWSKALTTLTPPIQSRAEFEVGSGLCPARFWILPRMPQVFSSLAIRLSFPSMISDCFPACQTAYDNTSYSSEIKVIKLWDLSCCLNCRHDRLYN